MKFLLNRRTFDTTTSTKVAVSRGIDHPSYNNLPTDRELRWDSALYRTAKGAFFVHAHYSEKLVSGGKPIITDEAREVTPEEAVKWIIDERAVVLDSAGLPMPEEA